jgi:hypothetical protein
MGYWAKLASRAAFRKGNAVYCGHTNPVTPGMWSGGVVGLKSILGVKKRAQALCIMEQLQELRQKERVAVGELRGTMAADTIAGKWELELTEDDETS